MPCHAMPCLSCYLVTLLPVPTSISACSCACVSKLGAHWSHWTMRPAASCPLARPDTRHQTPELAPRPSRERAHTRPRASRSSRSFPYRDAEIQGEQIPRPVRHRSSTRPPLPLPTSQLPELPHMDRSRFSPDCQNRRLPQRQGVRM